MHPAISTTTSSVTAVSATDHGDEYEALAKGKAFITAIMAVQKTTRISRFQQKAGLSYLKACNMIRGVRRIPERYATVKYTIKVRNKAEVLEGHLRSYVWKGGVDASGQGWCFAYGEEEWIELQKKADGSSSFWSDYRGVAMAIPSRRVSCP